MYTNTISIEAWYGYFKRLFADGDNFADNNLDSVDNIVHGESHVDIEVALFKNQISEGVVSSIRSLNEKKGMFWQPLTTTLTI